MSVTKFRDYIACPYRFYLRHVLNLQTISDEAAELDGGAFGDLVHLVLEQFGRAPDAADVRVTGEPSRIVEYLDFQLGRITTARYGKHVRPAVRVQIEQIRLRLAAFAEWQAARTRDGWRIVFSEDSEDRTRTLTAPFAVDGRPFTLRGPHRPHRLSRRRCGSWRCSTTRRPTAARSRSGRIAGRTSGSICSFRCIGTCCGAATFDREIPAGAPIELGYVLLPRDLSAVGLGAGRMGRRAAGKRPTSGPAKSCGRSGLSGSGRRHRRRRSSPTTWRSSARTIASAPTAPAAKETRHDRRACFSTPVIRASAGTGKTYQLAVRFIGLLAAGAQPEEILATTFTRKAAGEILERVLFWLAQAAADEASARRSGQGDRRQEPLAPSSAASCLATTIRKLHCLRVGTLDSYFIQVAGSFGQELGLPPGWTIGDELIDAALRDEAIELVLAHGRMSDLLTLVHSLTKGAAARSVAQLVHDTVGGLFELYRETSPAAWQQIAVCRGLPRQSWTQTLEALAAFEIADKRMATARGKTSDACSPRRLGRVHQDGAGAKSVERRMRVLQKAAAGGADRALSAAAQARRVDPRRPARPADRGHARAADAVCRALSRAAARRARAAVLGRDVSPGRARRT